MGNVYKHLFRFGLTLFIIFSLLFSLLINFVYVSFNDNKVDSIVFNKIDTVFIEKPIQIKEDTNVVISLPIVNKPVVIKEPVINVEPVTPKIDTTSD
jgi:hypothetical protein